MKVNIVDSIMGSGETSAIKNKRYLSKKITFNLLK